MIKLNNQIKMIMAIIISLVTISSAIAMVMPNKGVQSILNTCSESTCTGLTRARNVTLSPSLSNIKLGEKRLQAITYCAQKETDLRKAMVSGAIRWRDYREKRTSIQKHCFWDYTRNK